jgi:hypothetical protein
VSWQKRRKSFAFLECEKYPKDGKVCTKATPPKALPALRRGNQKMEQDAQKA